MIQPSEKLVQEILSTKQIKDSAGKIHQLDSNIDLEEGHFLQKIIQQNSYKKSIEIGCAYGISSLFICSAIQTQNGSHVIIDPFQASQWSNIGIHQLEKSGFHNFQLIEKVSELALPELLQTGETFDFAFIDGWHTFDHTLLDMYYLNRLLKVGGTMVIDDVGMQGVEKAVNYFLNYQAYEFAGGVSLNQSPGRNRFDKYMIKPLRHLVKLLPPKVREEIFSGKIVRKPVSGYSMVALKKITADDRPWNWYTPF
ncbi:MAG: class I SAM-dependent methyltransferase [Ferruginibacter sp.]